MKRLYRDQWDKKIAGVCGGFGQFLQIDPTVIRLLATFVCAITAFVPLIVAYAILWMVIPLGPSMYVYYHCRRLYRHPKKGTIAGICAGVAEFLKIDPVIVRLVSLALLFFTGVFPTLITYLVGIAIIPLPYQNRR